MLFVCQAGFWEAKKTSICSTISNEDALSHLQSQCESCESDFYSGVFEMPEQFKVKSDTPNQKIEK